MKKESTHRIKQHLLLAVMAVALVCITLFTRPSVDAPIVLLAFFAVLYLFLYYLILNICMVLRLNGRKYSVISAAIATVITATQLLLTFRSLKPVEFLLIVSVTTITFWYIHRSMK